jgi:four helix bundle protein
MTTFDHERLDVYQVAIEFISEADLTISTIPPGHASLADQLRRAATSICLNIAEGSGEFSPKEKARLYRIAKRSATECAAILDVVRIRLPADSLDEEVCEQLDSRKEMLRRIVSMLIKMVRRMEACD